MSRYSSTRPSRDSPLVEGGTTVGDQIVPRFALETPDLLTEIAAGDSRLGPVGPFQRPREDDLGDLLHRPRVHARRCRPEGGHLLVRNPTHQVSTRGPDRVEDPTLERLVLAPLAPRVRPVECGHVSVDRNARLKNEPAHGTLHFSRVLLTGGGVGTHRPPRCPTLRSLPPWRSQRPSLRGALHERRSGHSGGPERGFDSRRL